MKKKSMSRAVVGLLFGSLCLTAVDSFAGTPTAGE